MFITMDVVFHEDSMYFSFEYELQGEYHKEIQTLDYGYHISEEDEFGQSELVNQEVSELDMSGTTLEPSSNDHPEAEEVIGERRDITIKPSPPFEQFGSEDTFTEIPNQSSSAEGVLNLEPDPFMKRWKATMNAEMKSLQKNETWELVECPSRKKPVGCRWIYTVKYKANETFAPVAKINTVQLSEEVYMDLPSGCMVSEKQCQKVYKLKKSLYGLKQSPRAWFGRRSTSGYFTFVGGNLVTWKSKKLNVVARSSAKAKFRGMALGLSACDIAHSPVQHDRTKHVEVDRFFIKEKLDDKIVELPKIRLEDQLIDILTKAPVLSRVFSKF
ncbi:Retrovirus-related Pol polyprotein from transposon TNT 1-94 [Vitis vinifera]|uniref:Retrovirus-related Pol polyprotein from transposon TNT 1-94 n=1 Tax=Vitis vinifera TaxID=29760 RepID=A0A438K048_VITVI|nr:Retrovirus-related Pol polyprotein from transposon TNT 1-94 [Vitis vinifera]